MTCHFETVNYFYNMHWMDSDHAKHNMSPEAIIKSNKQVGNATMPSEEQIVLPDSPPFKIRHFVSTIRDQDFSRCWPFSQRILDRCLLLGMKVELPPLDYPSIGCFLGNCNNHTQISFSKCSAKAMSYGFSTESQQFDSKESPEISRALTGSEPVVLSSSNSKNMAKENVIPTKSCLAFSQQPDNGAVLKPCAESLWDDSAVTVSAGITSSSGSQLMGQGKADLREYVGENIAGKSGLSHVKSHSTAVKKEPIISLFRLAVEEGCSADVIVKNEPNHCFLQVAAEDGCSALVDQLNELHKTCTGFPSESVSGNIQSSMHHGKDLGDNSTSPTAIHTTALQITEYEPNVHEHKTEKSKHANYFGLHRSSSDASTLQVCPVCSNFSSCSNTALNAHIDHCLVLDEPDGRRFKKRFKIRKLRSMVDIYATAPTCTLEDLERSSQIWSTHKG